MNIFHLSLRNGAYTTNHLFAYGTLMCGDIMSAVAGILPSQPINGTLRGYRRYRVVNESYPAIAVARQGTVDGVIYMDIPAQAWERLDRFEGDRYERVAATVETKDGAVIDAFTYRWSASPDQLAGAPDWNFEEFLRYGKVRFLKDYPGFTGER